MNPPPIDIVPTATPPVPSGGSSALRISTAREGLYLLDPPLTDEPALEGYVRVDYNGKAPPADTAVDINGIPLKRSDTGTGAGDMYWKLDPTGAQPTIAQDGWITITARTGADVRTLSLPCPADVPVTMSVAPGGSLNGTSSLQLGWLGDLTTDWDGGGNNFPTHYYANAALHYMNVPSYTLSENCTSTQEIPRKTTVALLDVPATTQYNGYAAELRWQGTLVRDGTGTSGGFCGRVKRMLYAN